MSFVVTHWLVCYYYYSLHNQINLDKEGLTVFQIQRKNIKNIDWFLLVSVLALTVFGIIAINAATITTESGETFQVVLGQRTINLFSSRSLVYLKTQVIAAGLGVFALIFFTLFDYHTFGNFAKLLYAGSLGLLLLVLLFGDVRNGSKSWLTILGVTFQPAEIVKIVFILAYAKFIEDAQETLNEPLVLLRLLLLAIVPILMVYKQGDLGTASVFFVIAASMLFVAELDKKYIFSFLGMAILSMPVLWSRLDQYQKNRILVFLNPSLDITGAGYQVYQSKIAIGSGQFSGRGVSDAKFIQGGYLPFNHTDFIFSVVGEAFGFVGGAILLALFAIFFFRLILIAKESKDLYGSMIVIGVTAMLFFHVLENIGMTMGVMPVTGIPLPFISYGGTFLLTCFACIGLVLSVALRKQTLQF